MEAVVEGIKSHCAYAPGKVKIKISTEKKPRINTEIRSPEVRLIDGIGSQLGIIPIQEAIKISEEAGLDLVEVSPDAKPPVCRIMNYGKFMFELNKKQNLAKKKQKQNQVKELKFRPTTEEGERPSDNPEVHKGSHRRGTEAGMVRTNRHRNFCPVCPVKI